MSDIALYAQAELSNELVQAAAYFEPGQPLAGQLLIVLRGQSLVLQLCQLPALMAALDDLAAQIEAQIVVSQ